jgi:BolA protein
VSDAATRIESVLRDRFRPSHFELRDDSAKHVGHPGATSGGGHFHVVIVAEAFEGVSRLDQHRLVNCALADLFGPVIHALALSTFAPSEWTRES